MRGQSTNKLNRNLPQTHTSPSLAWSRSEPWWIISARLYSVVVKRASDSLWSWSIRVHWQAAEPGSLKTLQVMDQWKLVQVLSLITVWSTIMGQLRQVFLPPLPCYLHLESISAGLEAFSTPPRWYITTDFRDGPCVAGAGSWSINRSPCLWCTWRYKPIKGSLCRSLWRLEALAFTADWVLWTYPSTYTSQIQASHK